MLVGEDCNMLHFKILEKRNFEWLKKLSTNNESSKLF